ncbi:TetR/AcrR family transcriptional regulator C-terminal domain-containing protein [Luteimonas sp. M1R5S18]|uniref:TetR/AcrR family transcriptional regulator C-terminal domain-containing protein n=2 Tax=Luteimonas rhizosphaericola TaxID=3042024 RepID=A0ABT6JLH8_9GAMM|nr:TetR/AcrR family transcriptional regulator C-terminal domain-containing protein [Luteimonas rhizosphaericola]MDH5831534.1 TetR/AcrR family transcriptional regulator C-terminal domain-containing protein [Luteimonas rhizosphaericola]
MRDAPGAKRRSVRQRGAICIARHPHRRPGRSRPLTALLGAREHAMGAWIRAAAADGRLRTPDPAFATQQLESLIKGAAFWPQVAMGQPPLDEAKEVAVAESAVEMFLGYYG